MASINSLLVMLNIVRTTPQTAINYDAGFVFFKKEGTFCQKGEKIVTIYGDKNILQNLTKKNTLKLFTIIKKEEKIKKEKEKKIILKIFSTVKGINDKLISAFEKEFCASN